ncbi:metal-responsive CopG/Arc/MetJ family transcriptional regulator [Cytobacillus horneckiae]|uniref:hypothetical protein n=1 Tax=Cytobacillus horneckiae TaxID=549687 RepID=UPI0019D0B963|nr:hypothetical protein [Cytobacillus horneckiae]MBN6886993.1 hypothetical protein [Cytobacillus horneckiae]MCM3180210.1 ribbon-helix-helix domain-containing protein [Cytobacillus horneckiae]
MAHIRKDSSKPTTTISLDPNLLSAIEDYRFEKRKDNRSAAIADLITKGLRYAELLEKKKARMSV